MENLKFAAKKIEALAKEASDFKRYKSILEEETKKIRQKYKEEQLEKKLAEFLKGKTENEWSDFYNNKITHLLNEIEELNTRLLSSSDEKIKIIPSKLNIDKKTRKKYIKELNLNEAYLKEISPGKKKKEEIFKRYSIYESNSLAKASNFFFGKVSIKFMRKYPDLFQKISHSLHVGSIKLLSRSYISIALFTTSIVFITTLIGTLFSIKSLTGLLNVFFLPILTSSITLFSFYFYPIIIANSRKRKIKNDLPFVILHMSAVAGSGAQPISMFNLIIKSKEYVGLEAEIKKIVNYVNLFGYNLNTSLKSVALTTPSPEFKELLTGIITTIESGGNIKDYLEAKGEETMVNYKLERRKYIDSLSTYSDVYTGAFIAAPLLFFVTLAIIQTIGGSIFGLSVDLLSKLGTFIALPIMNVIFLLFLDMVKPE